MALKLLAVIALALPLSAQYKVVVPGTGNTTAFISVNPTIGNNGSCYTMQATNSGSSAIHNAGQVCAVYDSPVFSSARLMLNYPTSDTTWATGLILKNGNVGIGTNNPATTLEVNGPAQIDSGITVLGNGVFQSNLLVIGNISSSGSLNAGGALNVNGGTTLNNNLFVLGPTSTVAIGVPFVSFGNQLEVAGAVKFDSNLAVLGGLAVTGNQTIGGFLLTTGAIASGTFVTAGSNFSANGTPGVTSATCTQWTMGLCTHN